MKNKKIIIIGICVIVVCLLISIFMIFSSNIFAVVKQKSLIHKLEKMNDIEFVLLNDNRKENYFGGEYIETDPVVCQNLKNNILYALKSSKFSGTKENFLGGFALIVRISDGKNEITLWFYEDKVEFENGADIVICKMKDNDIFQSLLSYTKN